MTIPEKHAEYHVLKRGEMCGPFSDEDLRAGLAAGRFEKSDLVQVEGRVVWQPLERVLDSQEEALQGAVAPNWPCILKWARLRLRYNLDEQSVVVGTVCLAAGALSLALSHWAFVFWLPWFLLAAVAGIALIRRKHEGHGALLLAAVICLPMLFLIFASKASKSDALNVPQAQASVHR